MLWKKRKVTLLWRIGKVPLVFLPSTPFHPLLWRLSIRSHSFLSYERKAFATYWLCGETSPVDRFANSSVFVAETTFWEMRFFFERVWIQFWDFCVRWSAKVRFERNLKRKKLRFEKNQRWCFEKEDAETERFEIRFEPLVSISLLKLCELWNSQKTGIFLKWSQLFNFRRSARLWPTKIRFRRFRCQERRVL